MTTKCGLAISSRTEVPAGASPSDGATAWTNFGVPPPIASMSRLQQASQSRATASSIGRSGTGRTPSGRAGVRRRVGATGSGWEGWPVRRAVWTAMCQRLCQSSRSGGGSRSLAALGLVEKCHELVVAGVVLVVAAVREHDALRAAEVRDVGVEALELAGRLPGCPAGDQRAASSSALSQESPSPAARTSRTPGPGLGQVAAAAVGGRGGDGLPVRRLVVTRVVGERAAGARRRRSSR